MRAWGRSVRYVVNFRHIPRESLAGIGGCFFEPNSFLYQRTTQNTLTFMLIPDASRKTRSWRLPLLRIYALVGVATVLMGAAVIAYTWAGSSAAAILHYRHTLQRSPRRTPT